MSIAPELVRVSNHEYRCSGCDKFRIAIPQNLRPDESWIQARFKNHIERHHFTDEQSTSAAIDPSLANTRIYALRRYLMSAIADDYESFQMVVDTVADWASKDAIQRFDRQELAAELGTLIRKGYAKAYVLSSRQPHVLVAEYSESRADEFWYLLTVAGIRAMNQIN